VIKPGQTVDFVVEAFANKTFQGKVAYVSPSVDQATRTFPVEVLVENSDRTLKPGFFAKGTVLTHVDAEVLAAPEDAVSTMAGVSTVYVIEDGKARQQLVTLGVRQGKVVEIVDGLKGSEVLATSNVNQLATGTSVRTGDAGEENGGRGPGRQGRQGGRGRREGAAQ
jgi:membrane fusion protein (multidrug efflux system)